MHSIVHKFLLFVSLSMVLFLTSANTYKFHPFYVSVTEMNYNEKSQSFEISCKMFAEDIEDVLKQNYKTAIDLSNNKLQSQNNRLMNDYMTKHISFNINAKPLNFKFLGFEKDKESIYCYLEVLNVPAIKKLSVTNSILQDFKKEQINIIHVLVNGKRESTKIDYPQNQANFSF
jgi:hypothetical protein